CIICTLVPMYHTKSLPALLCLTATLWLWSPTAMCRAAPTQVRTFHLDAPLARVFPLFTALGEKTWADGWEPELLSGREERGSAFRTVLDGHETIWIVVDYRPAEGRVSYARLAQGSNIGLVDVQCSATSSAGTEVTVRYTLTGLNAQGEAFVSRFLDPEHYSRMIEEWRTAISAALASARSKP
ncbi:MAG TPA: hypothetical protein VGG96_06685, partial [Steroidobacteraceae bacterium]